MEVLVEKSSARHTQGAWDSIVLYLASCVLGGSVVFLCLQLQHPVGECVLPADAVAVIDQSAPLWRPPNCPRNVSLQAAEVRWGCSCQGISENFGVRHPDRTSFARAPEVARAWWVQHRCETQPAAVGASGKRPRDQPAQVVVGTHYDVCKLLDSPTKPWPPPVVTIPAACHMGMFGNSLSKLWMIRVAAAALGLRVRLIPCELGDPPASAFPYLRSDPPLVPALPESVNISSICRGPCIRYATYPHECKDSELVHMIPVIRHDLRAIARGYSRTQSNASEPGSSPDGHFDGDDVVIHLRVGDTLGPKISTMGLTPWWFVTQALSGVSPRSIGIVTIAGAKRMRYEDWPHINMSMAVLTDLTLFLRTEFPGVEVRIHNGPHESPTSSISRLVLARKRTVCTGISTFCLWAAIAAVGEASVPFTDRMYSWVRGVHETNLHFSKPPILSGTAAKGWNASQIIAWLRQKPPTRTPPLRT
eukprot:m.196826 g.196826  ORF g.196826 m.196826 type:complete len:476 (-) comp15260_c1_seq2:2024-3451(-)